MKTLFDHEKLEVYQQAIAFAGWVGDMLELLPESSALRHKLDSASISMALNIAKGKGKRTKVDRCRFFDLAKGDALKCAASLDAAVARRSLETETALQGKTTLASIETMLAGLIQANDPDRPIEIESIGMEEGPEEFDGEMDEE